MVVLLLLLLLCPRGRRRHHHARRPQRLRRQDRGRGDRGQGVAQDRGAGGRRCRGQGGQGALAVGVVVVVLDVAGGLLEGLPAADAGEVVTPGVAVTGAVVAAAADVFVRGRSDGVMMDIIGYGLVGVRVRGRRGWSLGGQHGAVGIQRAQHGGYVMMWSGRFQRSWTGIQVKCFTDNFFLCRFFSFASSPSFSYADD